MRRFCNCGERETYLSRGRRDAVDTGVSTTKDDDAFPLGQSGNRVAAALALLLDLPPLQETHREVDPLETATYNNRKTLE